MSLPNRSIRIDPAHTDILNMVLSLLRANRVDELRDALTAVERGVTRFGPFSSGQAAQDFLIRRMILAAKPSAIWLFGSRARDDARPDSDFDFLAIFPDDRAGELDSLRHQLADAVQGSGIGVDIAVCSETEFENFRTVAGSLIRTVHEQGRQVYASRERRRKAATP